MKTCPRCGASHEKPGKFCSRSCANSRERSVELKNRLSSLLTGRVGHPSSSRGKHLTERTKRTCAHCGTEFEERITVNRKFCSTECRKANSGGYRPGSGRAKTGYYKGIYCGSTYELAWVIYNLDHQMRFDRFPGCLEHEGVKYYPDFILDDGVTIVEIKGYESEESVNKKSKVAEHHGYTVRVLRKPALKTVFDYVRSTYNVADFQQLYDDYKPTYTYQCSCCGIEFATEKRRKTAVVYCSRRCSLIGTAAKYREKNNESPSSKGRTQPFQG
jgi:endogenous inhibitor of DNA gyrase (YacG/DUF329 family)